MLQTSAYQGPGSIGADVPQQATITQKAIRVSCAIGDAMSKAGVIRDRISAKAAQQSNVPTPPRQTPDHVVFAQEQSEADLAVLHSILDDILSVL